MKKREFEAIGKKLLPELPGFVQKGAMLFMSPVGHTLRAIYFAGSIDSERFYPHVLIQPLFVPEEDIGFNIGWRLGGESYTWSRNNPDLLADLATQIKEDALPFFGKVTTPRSVAEAAGSLHKSEDQIVRQAIDYSIAYDGTTEEGVAAMSDLTEFLSENYPLAKGRIARAEYLKTLLADDPDEARSLFDTWQAESISRFGLQEA